jgi:hypothetical protein
MRLGNKPKNDDNIFYKMKLRIYEVIKVHEKDKGKTDCATRIRQWIDYILQRNDLQVFPLTALFIYTIPILKVMQNINTDCPRSIIDDWLSLEVYLYLSNILGLGIYLLVKALVNRQGKKD